MSPLKRQRILVEQKALVAQRDEFALAAARRRLVSLLKREITAPATLLTLFVAGVALGAQRRIGHNADEAHAPSGRLSRAASAWLSAARLLELARKAEGKIFG